MRRLDQRSAAAARSRRLLLCGLLGALPAAGEETAPKPPTKLWTDGRRGPPPLLSAQSFSRLVGLVAPAVVSITVVVPDEGGRGRQRGQGAGFVIEASGYVLTNHHVIHNAESIRVRFADEREFSARLIGSDERTDIAVVKVDPPPGSALREAPLGDSDHLEIGEWVVAIGNPFGLEHTVTAGIVSAKGRRDLGAEGAPTFIDFIQTDASINVGNSGGPLFNLRGEVIGINTAIKPKGQGIAFAIPINMAKALLPQLVAHGRVARTWLGLYPQPVTATLRRAFGLKDTAGALVSDVVTGGPADQAGVLPGDVIIAFDEWPIHRSSDLPWRVALAGGEHKATLRVLRAGVERKLVATLAAPPDEVREAPPPRPRSRSPLGITVSQITEGIARDLHQPGLRGVAVTGVESDSPAAEAGVERGDVVLRFGEQRVDSLADYAAGSRAVAAGGMIKLLVRRDGRNLWVAFEKR